MKTAIALISLATTALSAETALSDFRWNNRLLVIPVAREGFAEELDRQQAELKERDLRVFILGGSGASRFAATPKLSAELTKRFPSDPAKPQIHLIGKDGATTLSWTAQDFTFEKLYAAIDAMPMRRREMRE